MQKSYMRWLYQGLVGSKMSFFKFVSKFLGKITALRLDAFVHKNKRVFDELAKA